MTSSCDHVDLNRQFADLAEETSSESAALQSYMGRQFGPEQDAGWGKIYREDRSCVILGEPGSGKSAELRQQAKALRDAGHVSVYVNLRALVTDDEPYLDDTDPLIRRWRQGTERAWFFLDSVDESKLEHASDFQIAIRRMAHWAGGDSDRARYVISSRISEWQVITDKRVVEEALLTGEQRKEDERLLSVLTLLPLSEAQARKFQASRANGTVDEDFFAAVEQSHAWDFIRRPLDIADLYDLWRRQGRLGTLTEVVENAIGRFLEDGRNRATLAAGKAREGAELLAACLALNKSVSLALQERRQAETGDTSIPLRESLPNDWTAEDAALLIQLPLFDAAAFGKVRFHHRTYQDYLASSWLCRQMHAHLLPSELRHLLFAQSATGDLVMRPSLAPVAAWLACLNADGERWQEMLRLDLLEAAPWVFFAHGDPQQLPIGYREDVLRRTVERYKGRTHVHINWDGQTLRRFADSALSPLLSGLITDKSVPDDVRADYIALVRHGRLISAMPSVLVTACDGTEDDYIRGSALICVAEIGEQSHKEQVVAAFSGSHAIPLRLGVDLAEIAYPAVVDERGLFCLLDRMAPKAFKSRPSSLYSLDHYIEQDTAPERLPSLLEHLCAYVADESGVPQKDRIWVLDWLGPLLEKLFKADCNIEPHYELIFRVLDLLGNAAESGSLHPLFDERDFDLLQSASKRRHGMRRAWYWRKVEQFRNAEGKEPSAIFELGGYHSPLKTTVEDLEWWQSDIRARTNQSDRVFALRVCLFEMGRENGWPLFPRWKVSRLAIADTQLRQILLQYIGRGFVAPIQRLQHNWKHEWNYPGVWRRRLRPAKNWYWRVRNRFEFWVKRSKLRQGEWLAGIRFIVVDRADSKGNHWGTREFAPAINEYGAKTVLAALEGADIVWRKKSPQLPHEKPDKSQTSILTILGLTALEQAWNERGVRYFQSLSPQDTETAARYALDELNGFPPWFPELAKIRHGVVRTVVEDAIRGEWSAIGMDPPVNSPTLHRLVYDEEVPGTLYLPVLHELLGNSLPGNSLVLHDSLRLAVRHAKDVRSWLVPRCLQVLEGKALDESTWPWLYAIWLLDAGKALAHFEARLEGMEPHERDATCQTLCAGLHDDFRRGLSCPAPDFERPEFLKRLVPLVYRHIRPEEDINHDGVFSPGERDHAERFRGSLLGRLENNATQEAEDVLIALADTPGLVSARDYVLMRLDNRKAIKADDFHIVPEDVLALQEVGERMPRSRADLFHTAWTRLRTFKELVESAEVSIRTECGSGWDEAKYQDWVQRHMQTMANGKYSIPSEAKVDPCKFPDLRFETPSVDGAVSVEVKVATFEHWSYSALEERLRNQLVGQYLRAPNAKYGVFMLFRENSQRTWRAADGRVMDWTAILESLASVAKEILSGRPDIERLEVLGVDVTPPTL